MPHPFRFAEQLPHATVAPWVARIWEFTVQDGAPPVHYVPPDGCTSLLVACSPYAPPRAMLSGPWLTPLPVPVTPGARFVGLRFRCGGAGRVLGIDPATLVNRTELAEPLLGPAVAALSDAIAAAQTLTEAATHLTRFLVGLRAHTPMPDEMVSRAVTAMETTRGKITMAEVARSAGVSAPTLRRRFREAAGITPKQFARIVRLRAAALAMLGSTGTLSRIAAQYGYADQSHLTNDAVTLIGLTPAMLREIVWQTDHDLAGS
jgi:AraC-like DNA-binding protein